MQQYREMQYAVYLQENEMSQPLVCDLGRFSSFSQNGG